uniref:Uncharacterized protein n=1 Tax=Vespula pensylvanica TaxID=30213 RepID=A0A834U9X2_VESPE|nr:hypothetical protein H0235_007534 [Vespula pensylvanica]
MLTTFLVAIFREKGGVGVGLFGEGERTPLDDGGGGGGGDSSSDGSSDGSEGLRVFRDQSRRREKWPDCPRFLSSPGCSISGRGRLYLGLEQISPTSSSLGMHLELEIPNDGRTNDGSVHDRIGGRIERRGSARNNLSTGLDYEPKDYLQW